MMLRYRLVVILNQISVQEGCIFPVFFIFLNNSAGITFIFGKIKENTLCMGQ